PIFGPLLAAVATVTTMSNSFANIARAAIPAAFVFCLCSVTVVRSLDWGNLDTLRMSLAFHHPNSARSNYEAGLALGSVSLLNPMLAPLYYAQTKMYFERSIELDDTSVNGLFGLILLDQTNQGESTETLDALRDRLS